ncbi:flavin reductase family protein [Mesorhizobium sp. BR1-1-16]|uniref:flavin reductase family protein n=1 Tax=Mesorhizobium sp. BR1-1-16 TaxID=2876653 RepID=UPI001CCE466B|nr:flavin reductase family protein [Mesorhizobium sp. BR1-1-16]MBZ9937537.1 flavin reductase family protein [Mesorhizobium sp. BR1-1-16]
MTDAASPGEIDAKTFWRTLGQRATGMTVVTSDSDDGPTGFLGLSASHVTANPPTMLVSIDRKTHALAGVLARRHFAINYLPAEAGALADAFAGRSELSGAARFAPEQWMTLSSGAPILKSALGAFDCAVTDIIEHGDISIVIGRVLAVHIGADSEPLIFFRGKSWRGVGEPA